MVTAESKRHATIGALGRHHGCSPTVGATTNLSGEPPTDTRDSVVATAAQAFDVLCSGLHADADQASQKLAIPK